MALITDLSPELIIHILSFSDWPSHLHLALSCRYLAQCSQRTMAHHARCHARYKATSDIQPTTLPALGRALLRDPIAVSHVLALEFWGQRDGWEEWVPYAIQSVEAGEKGGMEAQGGTEVEGEGKEFRFERYELDAFERIMRDEVRFGAEEVERWRERMERGDDGALKGMLVALCPNLQAVRFVKYAEPEDGNRVMNEDEDEDGDAEELYRHHHSCLDFLCAAIDAQHEDATWSPGLNSVSRIAIGIPSRAATTSHDTFYRVPTTHATPLFLLPHLRSLYLNGLSPSQADLNANDRDEDTHKQDLLTRLPPGSSPHLRELVLEDADLARYGNNAATLLKTLMKASSNLRHMAFQGGDISGFDLHCILPDGMTRMRSLLFYGDVTVEGYRSEMYYPEYIQVPIFTVDISDVMLCAPSADGDGDGDGDAVGRWRTSRTRFGEFLWDCFGDGWEAIVFVGYASAEEAEMIDEGLARFVRSVDRGWLYEEGEDEDEEQDEDGDGEGEEDAGGEEAEGEEDTSQQGHDEDDNDMPDRDPDQDGPTEEDQTSSSSFTDTRAIYLQGIALPASMSSPSYPLLHHAATQTTHPFQIHTRDTPTPTTHSFPFPWPASDKELQTSPLWGSEALEGYVLRPDAGLVVG